MTHHSNHLLPPSIPAEHRFSQTHLTNSDTKRWQLQLSCQSVVLSCKTISQCSLLLTLTCVLSGQVEAAMVGFTTAHKHIFSFCISKRDTYCVLCFYNTAALQTSAVPQKLQQLSSMLQTCNGQFQALCLQLAVRHTCFGQMGISDVLHS